MKQKRTDVDNWFMQLVGNMSIDCDQLKESNLPIDFTISDFDALHELYREEKGL